MKEGMFCIHYVYTSSVFLFSTVQFSTVLSPVLNVDLSLFSLALGAVQGRAVMNAIGYTAESSSHD